MMIDKSLIKSGDLFLIDSDKFWHRVVKFFQTAPTWIQHIWRKIRGTQEVVNYYHVGMFYTKDEIIEQQWKVIKKGSEKILNSRNRVLVARRIDADIAHRALLMTVSEADMGEGYDIVNIFGKLLTWLTGIPLFGQYMQIPNQEICVNRVAYWYKEVYGETFGEKTHSDVTTHEMAKYIKSHPEKFEIVFDGIPRNE